MDEISTLLVNELPKAILGWYPFEKEQKALLISYDDNRLRIYKEMLLTAGLIVDAITACDFEASFSVGDTNIKSENDYLDKKYDYIALLDAAEYFESPEKALCVLQEMLNIDGTLIISIDNRFGLRYFCGDRDRFTGRNFDGIENYIRINEEDRSSMLGRAYSKAEISDILNKAGFECRHSFSVLPCVDEPQLFYAEDYLPEEDLEVRFNFHYNYPQTVFLEEERLYGSLIKNGMFHQMAGGYLFECSNSEKGCKAFHNTKHVTISLERGREDALATIIKRDGTVSKRAIYPEGRNKLLTLVNNERYLMERGISVVGSRIENDEYIMPYIRAETATEYFKRLLLNDERKLICELKRFLGVILKSSEYTDYVDIDWYHFVPGSDDRQKADDPNKAKWYDIAMGDSEESFGKILKKGFIDMVCHNCFVIDGEFVFYDQEFTVDNLPARTILWRTIHMLYLDNPLLNKKLPMIKLLEMLGISEYEDFYASFSHDFIGKLRHWKELRDYHTQHVRNANIVNSNRQRMNYSQEDYQKLFVDIFKGIEGRKLFLFGSGNYAKMFISQFDDQYEIEGLIDNSSDKWGKEVEGYPVCSPEVLNGLNPASYKVIICIKNYVPVLKQLKEMGATNYSLYDWNLEYPRKLKITSSETKNDGKEKKPYHIGYVAGVFDLFHIGHLNLLRRAKEQCDYLIVGVVTDIGVVRNKKTTPYIPFEERLQIVQACEYVDEAVEIPPEYYDTEEAYRRYQFDVQFSGSDYENDPDWLRKRDFLRKRGSDMVFFPYTKGTSSTKLKAIISGGATTQESCTVASEKRGNYT